MPLGFFTLPIVALFSCPYSIVSFLSLTMALLFQTNVQRYDKVLFPNVFPWDFIVEKVLHCPSMLYGDVFLAFTWFSVDPYSSPFNIIVPPLSDDSHAN